MCRAGIAARHDVSFPILSQFLDISLDQSAGRADFHTGETETAAGIDCRTAFHGEYPGRIFFVIEGVYPDTPYVAADTDASTADDAQVIITQEERIICFERIFFWLVRDFRLDADVINHFLEFTVTVLRAGNAVLTDRFAAQAYIEGFAPVPAPAVETRMGVFGQYFLKGFFSGFPDGRCFGGYHHAVADFRFTGLYIAFFVHFYHAQTAVATRYKVGMSAKSRDIYPGFLGCP
jgi:hypothetical protein